MATYVQAQDRAMEGRSIAPASTAETCFAPADAALAPPLAIDLSRRGLAELPRPLPDCGRLQRLYLEGNCLGSLPETLFRSLPNLQWLDLRNNQLSALPGSVESLRSLRTLLLAGNSLTHLPPQLGLLSHLVGLSLHRNPLMSPPQHVVGRGTRAVLHYLQQLSDAVSGDPPTVDSPDPPTEYSDDEADFSGPKQDSRSSDCAGAVPPLAGGPPLHRPATLHTHSGDVKGRAERKHRDSLSPALSRNPQRREGKKLSWQQVEGLGANRGKAKVAGEASSRSRSVSQQLTAAEQGEIATALDRQRSKDYLEKWRQETRRLQVESQPSQHPASVAATAPYGTDSLSPASGRGSATMRGHHEAREAAVGKKMHRYVVNLQEQRQRYGQTEGLSELQEAERRLAETMAERRALESQKTREYRLTAFTGDLPLGAL